MSDFVDHRRSQFRLRAPRPTLALATIALGLAVHLRGASLGPAIRDVLGDALWAAMIFWLVGAITPHAAVTRRAGAALAFCFAIEFSQLWHTPALDALRSTTAGHLVLGSGFDPRDFAAYSLGVFAVWLLACSAAKWRHPAG